MPTIRKEKTVCYEGAVPSPATLILIMGRRAYKVPGRDLKLQHIDLFEDQIVILEKLAKENNSSKGQELRIVIDKQLKLHKKKKDA